MTHVDTTATLDDAAVDHLETCARCRKRLHAPDGVDLDRAWATIVTSLRPHRTPRRVTGPALAGIAFASVILVGAVLFLRDPIDPTRLELTAPPPAAQVASGDGWTLAIAEEGDELCWEATVDTNSHGRCVPLADWPDRTLDAGTSISAHYVSAFGIVAPDIATVAVWQGDGTKHELTPQPVGVGDRAHAFGGLFDPASGEVVEILAQYADGSTAVAWGYGGPASAPGDEPGSGLIPVSSNGEPFAEGDGWRVWIEIRGEEECYRFSTATSSTEACTRVLAGFPEFSVGISTEQAEMFALQRSTAVALEVIFLDGTTAELEPATVDETIGLAAFGLVYEPTEHGPIVSLRAVNADGGTVASVDYEDFACSSIEHGDIDAPDPLGVCS